MHWFSGILVYVMIWWTLLFTVLPFGGPRDERGMPENPQLKKKALITSVISAVVWLLVFSLIKANIISFHDIAVDMTKQDYGT